MIGIDLVEIARIVKDIDRLANKILSLEEIEEYSKLNLLKRKAEYVAGRWAAKEAIYKALNEQKGYDYKDFSILNLPSGKPYVKSSIALNIEISISHTDNYVTAVALVN